MFDKVYENTTSKFPNVETVAVDSAYKTPWICKKVQEDGYREYKSNPKICKNCPHLNNCTHSKNHQKIVLKHIWEKHIELTEDFRHSPDGKESYALRKETIERVFANTKENHGLRYTLLRGLNRVSNWVRLKFATLNLKKLAMWA